MFCHSLWWTLPTSLRYPPPVSSCCWYSLLSHCAVPLCLFSSTRGDTLSIHTNPYIHLPYMQDVRVRRFNTTCIQSRNSLKFLLLCIFLFSFFIPPFSRDMPCTMSLIEIKSLFRMDDIIASATQPITILELSARSGQGLQEVLSWLESITVK